MKRLPEDLQTSLLQKIKDLTEKSKLKSEIEKCFKALLENGSLDDVDIDIYMLFNEILSKNYLTLDITYTLKEINFPSDEITNFIKKIELLRNEKSYKELDLGFNQYENLIDIEIETLLKVREDIVSGGEDFQYSLALVYQSIEGEIKKKKIVASELQLSELLWNFKMMMSSIENSKESLTSLS